MSVIHSMSLGDIALGGLPARKGSVYYLSYLIFFLTFQHLYGPIGDSWGHPTSFVSLFNFESYLYGKIW